MSAEYREKLKSIGLGRHSGESVSKPVLSDKDGKPCGYQTYHWDGRVDATAQRFDVHKNPNLRPMTVAEERAHYAKKRSEQ